MKTLVDLLRENARLSNEQLATILGISPETVAAQIKRLEDDGMIIGYSAIINEEKLDKNSVTALIELKVSPKVECGYDDVAKIIAQYDEVDTVQLMSGSFDLAVIIKGTNLRDVALFVSDRLATLDGVLSTTTHFILQRYKEKGVNFAGEEADERSLVSP
ncbi:MAG: Lrp/AsnC family transcriptional regulator [Firmicutes bacterium]|nr:Lrp/AsnC family transcriptional regulator [[Eubacterium] siraeum]MCM1488797.1 Lrp/AsnC family transcriptional regulator [Bacillota bacterium]